MKSKILIIVSLNDKEKLQVSHTSGMINENLFKKIKNGKNKIKNVNEIKLFYVDKKAYAVIESLSKSELFFSVGIGDTADKALFDAEKKLEEIMSLKNPKYRLIEKTA